MSAFVGLFAERFVYVGTDTLVRAPCEAGDESLRPILFTSKTFHLPQFKSIFAVTGHQDLGYYFYRFVTKHCIGLDINSLINIGAPAFEQHLNKQDDIILTGTLYLFGFDTEKQQFRGYWLPVNKSNEPANWQPMLSMEENGISMSPMVEGADEKVLTFEDDKPLSKGDSNINIITRLIKVQRQEDLKRPIADQAGIGGEIMITIMGFNQREELFIQSSIPYAFPDYLSQGEQMIIDGEE